MLEAERLLEDQSYYDLIVEEILTKDNSGSRQLWIIKHITRIVQRARTKANLRFDLAVILDEYGYLPVTIDDVYKEVLEQAENFKKYAS